MGPLLMRDENLDQVLSLLEEWTGKTYLRPQSLPATQITLSLQDRVTKAEAIRAIESLLTLNGVALTPLGDRFVKVTALNAAKSETPELIDGSTLSRPPSGQIASKIFQLNFLQVSEFMPQIAGMLSAGTASPPMVFEKANAALITDTVSNLQRIEAMLARLDQPMLGDREALVFPVNYAKASDVVAKMRSMLTGPMQSQLGTGTIYNADDRANQIIVFTDPKLNNFFGRLITKLDVKSGLDTINEVIYLKHASSKDVATTLAQLVTGQAATNRNNSTDAVRPLSPSGNTVPVPSTPTAQNSTTASSGEFSNRFSSALTIIPDERTNSIVVSGTVDDLHIVRDLVDHLDILLAQVRIEVVIAEVSLTDNATSGISALGLKIDGDKLVSFSGATPGMLVKDATITRPGIVGAGPYDLAAEITLATTPRKTDANILSVPNIITTHNKAGKIFVGEQRPVISSYINDTSVASNNNSGGYRSTVNSKDIGIQLTVKPLIGNDGSVQLEIEQEVNDVLGEIEIDGNAQPRIGRRSTESFVSVKSGEIIVLGGLQRTSTSRNSSRLGPIPIIGDLLGTRSREKTRTDLIFFLRPTVLSNPTVDNAAAIERVEKFPKDQREQIKKALSSGS